MMNKIDTFKFLKELQNINSSLYGDRFSHTFFENVVSKLIYILRLNESNMFGHSIAEFEARYTFASMVGWSIPTIEVINKIHMFLNEDSLIDIGCGHGFWSSLMNVLYGINVLGVDIDTKNNRYVNRHISPFLSNIRYFKHRSHMLKYLKERKPSCLFFNWPEYDENWAHLYLKNTKPNKVIYVGEGYGGCTANDKFHDYLDNKYEEVDHICIPRWSGIRDSVRFYVNK